MPLLSRWYIRTGIFWLIIALALRVLMATPGLEGAFATWAPSVFHVITVGWITQLIFGVAWWMFPRYSKENPRGREWLGWLTFGVLNAGVVLRLATEPFIAGNRSDILPVTLLLVAAFLQWLAAVLFVLNTWKRLEPRKK